MFEPLFKSAPVRRPAKVNLLPYDVRPFKKVHHPCSFSQKLYHSSSDEPPPATTSCYACAPSSCTKILDTRIIFLLSVCVVFWQYWALQFLLSFLFIDQSKKNGKNLQAWFISIECGSCAQPRARLPCTSVRYEFNRPKLYTIYPGIQSEIVISCLHGLKRISFYSMLTLDLLAGVFNASQKCAIAANCITCYFQMCDKYKGYKPGYMHVIL